MCVPANLIILTLQSLETKPLQCLQVVLRLHRLLLAWAWAHSLADDGRDLPWQDPELNGTREGDIGGSCGCTLGAVFVEAILQVLAFHILRLSSLVFFA